MTTKNLIKFLIIFTICTFFWVALIYGLFAFTIQEINPAHWDYDSRLTFALCGCLLGVVFGGIVSGIITERDMKS